MTTDEEIAALRECIQYARAKRGNGFDFDIWTVMCDAALAGKREPGALENEIAAHAITKQACDTLRKEHDELKEALSRCVYGSFDQEGQFHVDCTHISHREGEFHKFSAPCALAARIAKLVRS